MAKSGKESAVSGGKGTGKHKAAGKSGELKKSTGKMKAVSGKVATPKLSGQALVPVVCSDCYEDLVLDSGATAKELVCPICEHAAGAPNDAAIHDAVGRKAAEKKNFMIAFIVFMIGALSMFSWVLISRDPANAKNDGLWMGPVVVTILCFIATIPLAWKYEKNRVETYF